jgi:hypothetical protein
LANSPSFINQSVIKGYDVIHDALKVSAAYNAGLGGHWLGLAVSLESKEMSRACRGLPQRLIKKNGSHGLQSVTHEFKIRYFS